MQLPDRQDDVPEYVKTNASTNAVNVAKANSQVSGDNTASAINSKEPNGSVLKPIDNGVKTLQLNQTADTSKGIDIASEIRNNAANPSVSDPAAALSAGIGFGSELKEMKAGEKVVVPVLVQGNAAFHSAVLGLKFDQKKMAVRSVSFGDIFGPAAVNKQVTPFLNQNGKMFALLSADGQNNSFGRLSLHRDRGTCRWPTGNCLRTRRTQFSDGGRQEFCCQI